MRVRICKSKNLDVWISQRHYLGNTPPGVVLRLWILDDAGAKIGAMMRGRPTARAHNGEQFLS